MGKKPGWIDTVNSVTTLIQNPCHAPWTVYAELALEPAGEAVSVFFSFNGYSWFPQGTTTLATYITAAGGSADQVGFGIRGGSTALWGLVVDYYSEVAI